MTIYKIYQIQIYTDSTTNSLSISILSTIFVEIKTISQMKEISIAELNENMVNAIGKEWMLVTAGNKEKFNTMTASWGGIGVLWGKTVAFVFIRPERYTYEFIEKCETLTLSFLGEENKSIHKVCGSKSGRNTDKIAETGLVPQVTESGNITFSQSRLTLECRKLYADDIKPEMFIDKSLTGRWYGEGHGNYHKMYIVEIEHILVK